MDLLISSIFKNKNIYLTKDEIIQQLSLLPISEEEIKEALLLLDNPELFINIDKYYKQKLSKKNLLKLPEREIIRYVVRNKYNNSEYGNFHHIEYHYIIGLITNELLKLGMPKEIINSCIDYVHHHPNEQYDGDRYILNQQVKTKQFKVIYKKIFYKLRNLYVVYNNNFVYFCTKEIINKDGEIIFLDKKYYHTIFCEYYDIKSKQFICDDTTIQYHIVSLRGLFDTLSVKKLLSFQDVEGKAKEYIMKI